MHCSELDGGWPALRLINKQQSTVVSEAMNDVEWLHAIALSVTNEKRFRRSYLQAMLYDKRRRDGRSSVHKIHRDAGKKLLGAGLIRAMTVNWLCRKVIYKAHS